MAKYFSAEYKTVKKFSEVLMTTERYGLNNRLLPVDIKNFLGGLSEKF